MNNLIDIRQINPTQLSAYTSFIAASLDASLSGALVTYVNSIAFSGGGGSGIDTSGFATTEDLHNTGNALLGYITSLQGQTGNYVSKSGNQTISGNTSFAIPSSFTVKNSTGARLFDVTVDGYMHLGDGITEFIDSENSRLNDNGGSQSVLWGDRQLYDFNGDLAFDWVARDIYDSFGYLSVQGEDHKLGSAGQTVLDWANNILYTSSTQKSLDWANRQLFTQTNLKVADWQLNQLGSGASIHLDWKNNILSGNWSNNTSPTLPNHLLNKGYYDTNTVQRTGVQTISGVKTFVDLISAPSGISGIHYGSGANLIGVVNTTGAQTISGSKTFASPVSTPTVFASYIYNLGDSSQVIDIANHILQGSDWKMGSVAISTSESFHESVVMTKLVPGTAAESASLTLSVTSVPGDSNTLSFTIDATTINFEFNSSNPSNANVWIDTSSNDVATIASILAGAIGTQFGVSASYIVTADVMVTSNTAGVSSTISYSGPGAISPSNNTVFGVDGSPDVGTTFATIKSTPNDGRTTFISKISFLQPSSVGWGSAGLTVGYFDGASTYTPVYIIQTANLVAGSLVQVSDADFLLDPANFPQFAAGGATDLCIWHSDTSGQPTVTEQNGDDVKVVVQGIISL